MKSPFLPLALVGVVFLGASFAALRGEDWKTNDGKVYQDVKVLATEPDAVTILHHDGGGRILLANLPPDLQKRFNYDPAKAKAAAEARAREEVENGKALQAEMNEAADMRQPGADPDDTSNADATSDKDTDAMSVSTSTVPDSTGITPQSMAELSSLLDSLQLNLSDIATSETDSSHVEESHSDTSRFSINDIATSAANMRRDLADPAYHTMAHLAYSMRSLSAAPSSTHHTMDELVNLGL